MERDEDGDFRRWYGRWASVPPAEVAAMLAGVDAPWWIAGGWVIDAVTGEPRPHEDVDVGLFRADLPRFLEQLAPTTACGRTHRALSARSGIRTSCCRTAARSGCGATPNRLGCSISC